MHNWSDIFSIVDGNLVWAIKPANRVKIGDVAGCLSDGYRRFEYSGCQYLAHRIVWEMINGPIPEGMEVDHINHVRADNRIENLRLISQSDNARNKSLPSTNTSGEIGIHWNKKLSKWHVQINADGKRKFVGVYESMEEAKQARDKVKAEHGYHANHGLPNSHCYQQLRDKQEA
ncbi:HNH endonuclease [Enterobacter asburiae]|uniref:HNH endonuclease n=1 Tax=Enterobacter asburiae TaxID=61645 RepID=UPI0031BAF2AC